MEVLRSTVGKGAVEAALNDISKAGAPGTRHAEEARPRNFEKQSPPEMEKRRFAEEDLKDAVDQANDIAVMFDRCLKFEYRKEADIYQVSVIDTAKDEVIRKIPADEVVRFIERIKDMFGAMLDIQA